MKRNTLGQTGIEVSVLGFGTVKFGRNRGVKYPRAFELPSHNEMLELLSMANAGGINLLDTAPAYGDSEEKLGQLIQGDRDSWVICTKAGETFNTKDASSHYDFSRQSITASVEQSLDRLKTDYLDIVLIHSNGEDEKIILEEGALDTLSELKKQGKLRASGMSTKTISGGKLALDHSDCAMVTFNPQNQEELAVIEHARKLNKGILIKKLLNSGHEALNSGGLENAVKHAASVRGISSVIMGTTNPTHLQNNIGLFSKANFQ